MLALGPSCTILGLLGNTPKRWDWGLVRCLDSSDLLPDAGAMLSVPRTTPKRWQLGARANLGLVGIAPMCQRWRPVRCWDALGLPTSDGARALGDLGIRWDCPEMLALGA